MVAPVADAVRRQVEREAAVLFAEANPGRGELVWTEGFALGVRSDGVLHGFTRLSRGEQASAASAKSPSA